MKLNRIKKICMDEKTIRLYSVEATANAVMQWLGTDRALYAVEGGMLTMAMLKMLWEITPDKEKKIDMVEDTLEGAVERKLLEADDVVCLSAIPAMTDSESAPIIGIIGIADCAAIKFGQKDVIFAKQHLFEACYGKRSRSMEALAYDNGKPAWIAVYADGVISGMVRPTGESEAEWLWETAKQIAERKPASREVVDA